MQDRAIAMNPIANAIENAPLLERQGELEVVRDALDRLADGQGSMLLIEGPAGIGKTRLLAAATEHARSRGVPVLEARAGQLEREMPFVVPRELFEPLIERADEAERERLLSGSAVLSLIAFGLQDSGGPTGEVDPFAPIHGLYWLLANLCDSQPLLLVIDDAQWADTQSLRWLDFLARRVTDTPGLVLVGARTGEADEPDELEALRLDATDALRPSPLSDEAVDELISAQVGSSPSSRFSAACSRVTGGNPFLLTEVLRSLRMRSIVPDTEAIGDLAALAPEPVARSVRSRLQPFGAEAAALARAIAVLGGAPQLRHASRMARVGEDRARELCDQLRGAEILAPGHPIDFVHPLVRTAVYAELSEESRSDAHRRAAELISATGAAAREVAPHLMACAPNGDQWVVGQLRDAAREAMGAGAPDTARRYLERALEEPAREEIELTYELGRALGETSPIGAAASLVSVAERTDDPELHLQALQDAAWAYFDCGNLERAVDWLSRLVTSIPANGVQARLRAEASLFCVKTLNVGRRPDDSAHIEAVVAKTASTTPGELMVRQALSFDRFLRCDPVGDVVALAEHFPPPPWTGPGGGRARGGAVRPRDRSSGRGCLQDLGVEWALGDRARGGGSRMGGLPIQWARACRQLSGGRSGRDRPSRRQAGRLRGRGPDGVGDRPGSCAGVDTGAECDQQPRDHADRERPARRGGRARGTVGPLDAVQRGAAGPSPAGDPRHPSSGSRGARERSRRPDGGRGGPGGDADVESGRDSLAPGGRTCARGTRSQRRGQADRHRRREPGARLRRAARDRHDATSQILDRNQATRDPDLARVGRRARGERTSA